MSISSIVRLVAGGRAFIATSLLAFSLGCTTVTSGGTGTHRSAIDAVLDAPPLNQMHFGVLAVDVTNGRTLYARNASRKFVPASNQKILVTAAAIALLGADWRYRTSLWGTGPLVDGTLHGDLVLVGTGDPTLSDRYHDSGEAALALLAGKLRAGGVERVDGRLVVDASAWDSTTVGPTWEFEDLRYTYGATGGAFAIDHGEVEVVVRGGASPGEPAEVDWTPLGTPDFIVPRISTWPADSTTRVRSSFLPESRRLALEGRVGAGRADTLRLASRDPVRQAAAAMGNALRGAGVHVRDGVTVAWDEGDVVGQGCRTGNLAGCRAAAPLATLESPPLIEIVEGILEPSQNWMTEQLIRTFGAQLGAEGSWSEGIDVVTRFLTSEVGVDSLDVSPRDGSGLSAYNLVTPRAVVAVLRHMAASENGSAYRTAMAEPGEEESTLERRLPGLEGRLFAKTGTISNVNSLSGYLVGADGHQVVFSILSNGSGLPSSRVRAAIDDVVEVLAGMRR